MAVATTSKDMHYIVFSYKMRPDTVAKQVNKRQRLCRCHRRADFRQRLRQLHAAVPTGMVCRRANMQSAPVYSCEQVTSFTYVWEMKAALQCSVMARSSGRNVEPAQRCAISLFHCSWPVPKKHLPSCRLPDDHCACRTKCAWLEMLIFLHHGVSLQQCTSVAISHREMKCMRSGAAETLQVSLT